VTLVFIALMFTSGFGLLRIAMGDSPLAVAGLLGTAGLSGLAGGAVIGLSTTYTAVLGLPTTPWPVIAPVVLLLTAVAALPTAVAVRLRIQRSNRHDSSPPVPRLSVGDALSAAVLAVVATVVLWDANQLLVRHIDEWAIWAMRGRALSLTGHLDAPVFLGVAANYQHLDYPLVVPAIIAWGDGAHGRINDPAAHVLLMLLMLSLFAAMASALNRLAGPVAGVVGMVLILTTPTLWARSVTLLTADATLVAYTIALLSVLALWIQVREARLLPVAVILGAAAAETKVEGVLFTGAIFLAAIACAAGRRRPAWIALGIVVITALPWQLWTKVHGLNSDQINSTTLAPAHLRQVSHSAGTAVRLMIDFWPGHGWLLAVLAIIAAAAASTVASARRLVLFMALVWILTTVGMWAQYVISSGQDDSAGSTAAAHLRAHFASSAPRVLAVPAIILLLLIPVCAGAALRDPGLAPSDASDGS